MRTTHAATLALSLGVITCSSENPRYCDDKKPCPMSMTCDRVTKECVVAGCMTASDCMDGAPVCDKDKRSCRACQSMADDGDCDARDKTRPKCSPQSGQCVACREEKDCAGSPATKFCDASGRCVGCRDEKDCTDPKKPVCDASRKTCIACRGAMDDEACKKRQANLVCLTGGMNTGSCVECRTSADCKQAPKTTCTMNNTCAAGCESDANCTDGKATSCCAKACLDTRSDVANCGSCGRVCMSPANAVAACASGTCGIGNCIGDALDCDGKFDTGCEVNSASDTDNCGKCGMKCVAVPNSSPMCAGKSCVAKCTAGFENCDMAYMNGCEVSLQTDSANCGACKMACPVRANAMATCAMGKCGSVCSAGFGNCDNLETNGCEVNTGSDGKHCGGCGKPCADPANATAACTNGACGLGMCKVGFDNCDMNPGNGCEANVSNDARNCGKCGNDCAALPNVMSATCAANACTISKCKALFDNCDNNAANGCETANEADLVNCGKCGVKCALYESCKMGLCEKDKVLIVGATQKSYLDDVKLSISGTGAFAAVDSFDAVTNAPTAQQLKAYDAVLVFGNDFFKTANLLGDALADYFDQGGRVVVATTAQPFTGRFGTIANGYLLINPSPIDNTGDLLGTKVEPNSSLLTDVVKFSAGGQAIKSTGALANGGVAVANWLASMKALIVRGTVKNRNRADLNFFPPSKKVNVDYWEFDGDKILRNALLYK